MRSRRPLHHFYVSLISFVERRIGCTGEHIESMGCESKGQAPVYGEATIDSPDDVRVTIIEGDDPESEND